MALDSVPWFIGGGAEHSPAVARMLAYAATNGATGIISPSDLRVTDLPTPGPSVRIAPGGAAILNRYPGAPNQSYTVRNATSTDVAVPATTSSGAATRYLILRIDDPEYGGQTPSNKADGPYVRAVLVSSITNLAYPFVALAKITQPASTATITQAMITDLREVANPRTQRELLLAPSSNMDLKSSAFVRWPSYAPSVEVPEWATWVKIVAKVNGAAQMSGATYGNVRLKFGTIISGVTYYDVNAGASVWDGARYPSIGVVMSAVLPAAMRGGAQTLELQATNSNSGAGYLRADAATHIEYDIWFQEVRD